LRRFGLFGTKPPVLPIIPRSMAQSQANPAALGLHPLALRPLAGITDI
jgi:hypothetical protein